MQPRLVATDLDGTVVRSDGTVSPRTVAALKTVGAVGARVVLVTGRPPRWMSEVAAATGHTGLAVCANGALVYDLQAERVIERHPLSAAAALQVAAAIRAALPGVGFAVETEAGFSHEPGYRPRWSSGPGFRTGTLDELVDAPLVKLLVRHEQRGSDELLAAVRELVGHLAEVTHSTGSGAGLLEVSAAGVSKATTLARLCAERGIDAADVVAFGDMPNDLPMLLWAGQAYAMANAHPDVLAAVPGRAPANDEDGVAQVLERLFADASASRSGHPEG